METSGLWNMRYEEASEEKMGSGQQRTRRKVLTSS
jgi:hypothetical protein